jgi:glutamate--cysteine ligase
MPLPFQTPGYEMLELSTQLVIAEALRRGIKVEVLDADRQFIRLTKGKRVEYIESATKTSQDSYVMSEILGNKLVSKQILQENNFRVPKGKSFTDKDEALKSHAFFLGRKAVIKPKTTNYGIGISISGEKGFSMPEFKQALDTAFQFDRSLLIEEFLEGIECRFLVINKKCRAVLNRVPANVMGDGKRSIQELANFKNKDPRRGKGHKTPLEIIEIGKVEKAVLKEQNLNPKSIPADQEIVFLRRNSNISTGGDSIDFTDAIHPGYKKIAEQAVQAIGAKICGLDMIIRNPAEKPNKKNYGIIEVNYNPVLYFHDFPYQGKNRQVERSILDLLGF